jgi:hypothetical protein
VHLAQSAAKNDTLTPSHRTASPGGRSGGLDLCQIRIGRTDHVRCLASADAGGDGAAPDASSALSSCHCSRMEAHGDRARTFHQPLVSKRLEASSLDCLSSVDPPHRTFRIRGETERPVRG